MSSQTVMNCLCQLFSIFGMPSYIHTDRGAAFMSTELRAFLLEKGVATSRTTSYNPQANGQVERLNGTLWRAITLALRSRGLPTAQWESVLLDALHSIRSLLCTATNATPHERLFTYNRRSTSGTTLPTWLTVPGPVLLRRSVRQSKFDPLVEEVELLNCNPQFAHVRFGNGREDTVALHHLAPKGEDIDQVENSIPEGDAIPEQQVNGDATTDPNILREENTTETNNGRILLEKQQRVRPYNLRTREA
uniref:Integrase catalytic domain-containing protein n=1 Tax=Trichobilharzia regenti TaxID=157069 RepID=A0AA85JDF0_TRIRE|nr:unnamed protein product [Trichobilharzia regenti]